MKTVAGTRTPPKKEQTKPTVNWVFPVEDKTCGNCKSFTPDMRFCGIPFDREPFRRVDKYTNGCSFWERNVA